MSSNSNNNTNNKSQNSNRKGNKSKKANWKSSRLPSANKDSFKGDCEELKGKTYFVGSAKQVDNFNTTTEAIMEYFLREYTNGLDVVESLEAYAQKDFTSETPTLSIPTNATDEEKSALKVAYKEEMKQFIARKGMLRTNLVKAYGIIWGQCTKGLRAKLEARKNWNDGTDDRIKYKPINLLKAIKEITHNHQDSKYPQESIYFCIKNVFTMKQEDNEGLTDFTKRFNNAIDIMETQHGMFSMTAYLKTRSDFKAADAADNANVKKEIHKKQYD